MRKVLILLTLCLMGAGMPAVSAGAASAAEILAAADSVRNPSGSYSLKIRLVEYRQGQQVGDSSLMVFAKPPLEGGQYRNLVRILEPLRDADKLMLRNGLDLWFYDPASRASVRISPQQRLLGQASNGDVMTSQLAADYRGELLGVESIKDGEGQMRQAQHLSLKALRSDVAYPSVELWTQEGNHQPLMARYYTAQGRLLKTAYFRRYQITLGMARPTETVIIDALDKSWVTLMHSSQLKQQKVPDEWVQRDYLPHFKAPAETP